MCSTRVTRRESSNPYYDLFEDWDLIVSSFLSQYGLRIQTKEFETVSWDEFRALLGGLSPDTPIGRVVAIRSETDKDVLKHFTADQKRIYDAWRNREAENIAPETYDQQMKALEFMMSQLCGGGRN